MKFDLHFETTSVAKPLTPRGKEFYSKYHHTDIHEFVKKAEAAGLHLSYRNQELRLWLTEKK